MSISFLWGRLGSECAERLAVRSQRNADPGVEDQRAVSSRDHRVGIELGDFRVRFDHRAEAQQDILDRGQVALDGPAVAVEQRERAQRAQHLLGVKIAQWRDPDGDVPEQFDARAARAAGDHRAEALVVNDPEQQLDAGYGHRLQHEALELVSGFLDCRLDLACRCADGARVAEAERDGPSVGLVNQTRRDRLERDRYAELGRRGHCLAFVGDDPRCDQRQPVAVK
jgi:hypothetical protein